jgi:wyosine [tRNA(Phe)-imidazoG37] synthetase (radical SAM superfamily)
MERKVYVPPEEVLDEIKRWLTEGTAADYITISGSGEPTLHSRLGRVISGIHDLTKIPVALITNGSLFWIPEVRKECLEADVVLPSLDAGDPKTFEEINHPHKDLDFSTFVEGLCRFRSEYKGPIWLEVFFCEGINTNTDSVLKMRRLIEKIRPDRVQLNTAVRPTAHPDVRAVDKDRLQALALQLRADAEVIADFPSIQTSEEAAASEQKILDTLRRRPCGLEELCRSLQISPNLAVKHLRNLQGKNKIRIENRHGKTFYCAV